MLFLSCQKTPATPLCSEEMKKTYKFHFDDTCGGMRLQNPMFHSDERPIYMGIFFENGDTLAYAEKKDLEWRGIEGEDSLVAALWIDIESDMDSDSVLYNKVRKIGNAQRRPKLVFVAGLPTEKGIKHLRFCFLACSTGMFKFHLVIMWFHSSRYSEEFYIGYQQFVKRYERYLNGEISSDELY